MRNGLSCVQKHRRSLRARGESENRPNGPHQRRQSAEFTGSEATTLIAPVTQGKICFYRDLKAFIFLIQSRMPKGSTRKKAVRNGVSTRVVPAPPLPSWLRREWLWGLILIGAVILTYQPVWYASFVWDDDQHITANPCIIGPLGLKEIWTTSAAMICPLVLTTFWVEHALLGPCGTHNR